MGNFEDYIAQRKETEKAAEKPVVPKQTAGKTQVTPKKLRFSYKEQREFETIDDDIANLEIQISDCEAEISANASDYKKLQELTEKKQALETALEEKMERWVYLNDLAEKIANQE